MATLETCLMASYHADYMIASEETEPGCGWYYTNWIESLSADCSLSPEVYGKQIIDDYVENCYEDSPSMYSTLAMFQYGMKSNDKGAVAPTKKCSSSFLINNIFYLSVSTPLT